MLLEGKIKLRKNNLLYLIGFLYSLAAYTPYQEALSFFSLFLSFLIFFIDRRIYFKSEAILIFCFILSVFASSALTPLSDVSIKGSLYSIYVLFFAIILANLIKNKEELFSLLKGALIGYFCFYSRNIVLLVSYNSSLRFGGVTEQANSLGHFTVTGILLAFFYLIFNADKNSFYKKISQISLFLGLIILYYSASRGAILSVFSFIVIFLILSKKYKELFLLSIFSFLAVVLGAYLNIDFSIDNLLGLINIIDMAELDKSVDYTKGESDEVRLFILGVAMEAFYASPIYGYGANSFSNFSHFNYTHNSHVEIIFSFGVLGVLTYYSIFLSLIIKSFKLRKKGFLLESSILLSVIVYFFVSGMSIPNFNSRSVFYIYVFIFVFANLNKRKIRV